VRNEFEFLSECGVLRTNVRLQDKDNIVACIAKHHLIYLRKGELDQMLAGFDSLRLVSLMRCNSQAFLSLFLKPKVRLSASLIQDLFVSCTLFIGGFQHQRKRGGSIFQLGHFLE
jgi:hypothetical protein